MRGDVELRAAAFPALDHESGTACKARHAYGARAALIAISIACLLSSSSFKIEVNSERKDGNMGMRSGAWPLTEETMDRTLPRSRACECQSAVPYASRVRAQIERRALKLS